MKPTSLIWRCPSATIISRSSGREWSDLRPILPLFPHERVLHLREIAVGYLLGHAVALRPLAVGQIMGAEDAVVEREVDGEVLVDALGFERMVPVVEARQRQP